MAANRETAEVCVKCLEDNPRNFMLMTQICINQHPAHSHKVRVWKWQNNLEEILEIYPSVHDKPDIRPQPILMFLNFHGNFKLCHDAATSYGCRLGDKCYHAHSVEEMERWNTLKAQSKSQQASQTTPGIVDVLTCM